MNIVDALFGAPFIATGNSAAAMTQEDWAKHQSFMAEFMRNADPHPDSWAMYANYHPPVTVPQGFADWYAIGNELH